MADAGRRFQPDRSIFRSFSSFFSLLLSLVFLSGCVTRLDIVVTFCLLETLFFFSSSTPSRYTGPSGLYFLFFLSFCLSVCVSLCSLPLSSPPFAGVGLRCIPLRASILSHAFPSSSSSFLADRLFSSSSSSSFLDSEKLLSLVQEGEEGGEIHSNLSRTPQTHRGTGEEAPPAGGGGGGEREREKEEEEGPFYRLGNRPLLGRQLPFRWMFLRVRRKRRENFEEVENGAEEEEEPEEEGGGPAEANKDTKKDKKVEKRARKRRARGRKKKGLAGRRFVSQVIDFSSSSSSSSPKYACAPVMVLVRKQREEGGGGVAEKSGQREEALSTEADRKKSPQQKPLHETLHIQQILVRALP